MFKKIKIQLFLYFSLLTSILICSNQFINSFFYNDIYYFSISEFCDSQDYKYIYYEDKGKVAILFDNVKMTFSKNSSFVQADKQTVHLLNAMIIQNDVFYLPVNSFNILSDYYFTPTLSHNKEQNNLSITPFNQTALTTNIIQQDTIIYNQFPLLSSSLMELTVS